MKDQYYYFALMYWMLIAVFITHPVFQLIWLFIALYFGGLKVIKDWKDNSLKKRNKYDINP